MKAFSAVEKDDPISVALSDHSKAVVLRVEIVGVVEELQVVSFVLVSAHHEERRS